MIDVDWRSDMGVAAVLLTLVAAVALMRRLPRFLASRRARNVILRWLLPLVELAAAGTTAAWLLGAVTRGQSVERLVVGSLLVVGLAWAFRSVLQDFASGIALRMDGLLEPGAWIRAAGAEGRVRRVGYRSVEIETPEGTFVGLPFSTLVHGRIERSAATQAARAYTFTVEVARARPFERVMAELPALVLLSPWASTARPPEVRLLSENTGGYVLEVTARALDPDFASQIEQTVRRELSRLGA